MATLVDIAEFFTPDQIKLAYEAYKQTKTDKFTGKIKIPTGADGVTWQEFEADLDRQTCNISRRVLDGSYTFFPLLQYAIHKEHRYRVLTPSDRLNTSFKLSDHPPAPNTRILSIARIRDVLVQKQLYKALTPSIEEIFRLTPLIDGVSFGYRPDKSVQKAVRHIKLCVRANHYPLVVEADIKSFFDTVDHERLLNLIDDWIGIDSQAGNLLRKLTATHIVTFDSYARGQDFKNYSFICCKPEGKGIPQGGIMSGMLANLYLHDFDKWVLSDLKASYRLHYYRYADDFILLTYTEADAEAMLGKISAKLKELRLEIHDAPHKTGVRKIDEPA